MEKVYDGWLRGTDGGDVVEREVAGQALRIVSTIPALPGKDLK